MMDLKKLLWCFFTFFFSLFFLLCRSHSVYYYSTPQPTVLPQGEQQPPLYVIQNTRLVSITADSRRILEYRNPSVTYTQSNTIDVAQCIKTTAWKFKDIYCSPCVARAVICASLGRVQHIPISIHIQCRSKMKSDPDRLCATVAPVALLAQPAD